MTGSAGSAGSTGSAGLARSGWAVTDIGDLRGRVALITGANTGLGLRTAEVLTGAGATVVLACRDQRRAGAALSRLRTSVPGADAEILSLDLASLASVRSAAESFRARRPRLDLLINNAGLMVPPYGRTADGFELQFGTNHLGHFALTGLLLERLRATAGSRVVTVSSIGHRRGVINFDDLQSERGYHRMRAYAQSKLANLLFTHELQRRLDAAGDTAPIAVAAHPGVARTELTRSAPRLFRFAVSRHTGPLFRWMVQDEEAGALPILRAATDPAVRAGEYYGPDGWNGLTGRHPVRVTAVAAAHDANVQERLWTVSEKLTGVHYDFQDPATS
jgi:NAD(P)-dependent dehydrogenase (short-subunit alcohol dehydrogenase family)